MQHFVNPALAGDPHAVRALKDEVVAVEFATCAGVLQSAVGPNRYGAGDALLTGATGDRWCVARERFDLKYEPLGGTARGAAGAYRNRPATVLARRIDVAFSVERSAGGDVLHGEPGDWLVEYAPGDHGIVDRRRFARVYRIAAADPGGVPPCQLR
jgi:hypothetical protein